MWEHGFESMHNTSRRDDGLGSSVRRIMLCRHS